MDGAVKLDGASTDGAATASANAKPAATPDPKPAKVRGTRVVNPELVAMQRITTILEALAPSTRANVLSFVNRNFPS